jgi:RNA polymerase sigma-70 factor, ECF subfamily
LADEDEILRRCQTGDEAACTAMVQCLQTPVFRLAWRMTGNATLAEDATASILLKIWTRANRWSGESTARTWIYRLAVRTILDMLRGQKRGWRRWFGLATDVVDPTPTPAAQMENSEEQQRTSVRIQEAVAQLEPSDRALVHLYYFEDQSLPEIETILGINRDALKTRLARARQSLKGQLQRDGND